MHIDLPTLSRWASQLLLMFIISFPAQAIELEKILMPGELISGHEKYESECTQCHKRFSKVSKSGLCMDCHDVVADDVNNKQGYHGQIYTKKSECTDCHPDHKGRDADIINLDRDSFDHKLTDYPLNGAHRYVDCILCHKSDILFREAPGECYSCHKNDDIHQQKLGEACADCHNENAWTESDETFDHDTTDFPLKGKHRDQACNSCHISNTFKDTPAKCSDCHAVDDKHQGRYGLKCNVCHNEINWEKHHFEHKKDTDYALTGNHKKVQCDSCHKGQLYDNKPETACFSCHLHDDTHQGKNGKKCGDCHTTSKWTGMNFDHTKKTGFALKGKHEKVSCNACHSGSLFTEKTNTECYTCHKHDDVHRGQEGKTCHNCHNESGWTNNVIFDHDLANFPLIGLHATTPCAECHAGSTYRDATMECNSCHQKDDIHKESIGTNCALCHNPNSWALWSFNHNKQTDYELIGKHDGLNCSACHRQPLKKGKKIRGQCYDCHSQDDVHNRNFGRQCGRCHDSETFTQPVIVQ